VLAAVADRRERAAEPLRVEHHDATAVVVASITRASLPSPRVLLLDEPTKGVDVGAKFEIHESIRQQAFNGMAVLVASSDLPEILALADRILVMKEGAVQGELDGATATEEQVMHLATHETVHA
jgi:ABC-type sugar transport system ATPase subunit